MTGNACLGVIKWLLVTFTSEAKNGLNGLLASQFPPRGARWTASAGHHASVTTPEKKALRYSSGWRRFNVERALKMESVMSSFRLFMATSIGGRQPQSVQGNLNLCRATSICAGQPQSVQNNLNLCKTTSIHAKQPQFVHRKKTQKVTAYFRRLKQFFEPEIFSLARGYI